MSLDERAQILEATTHPTKGVRDLVQLLKWKTSNVVSLLRKMDEERLIEFQQAAIPRRGRPKKNVMLTPLGSEFLKAYKKLGLKPLRARREDLDRAAKDASYASRLAASGHSPFQVFMELNAIALNIKISSETPETV
jgi:DNA-binding MarR family transcriptional regulator